MYIEQEVLYRGGHRIVVDHGNIFGIYKRWSFHEIVGNSGVKPFARMNPSLN